MLQRIDDETFDVLKRDTGRSMPFADQAVLGNV